MPVFFIQSTDLVDGIIHIRGDLFTHLSKSLRTRPGESLIFNDEFGIRYHTSVQEITKQALLATVNRSETIQTPSRTSIILGQAVLKGDKMAWAIQKTTELGVDTIIPLHTDRTVGKVRPTQNSAVQTRWHRIGLEAAQQSERWTLPHIQPVCSFDEFLSRCKELPYKLILAERSTGLRISQQELPDVAGHQIVVAVGPEGGWSDEELSKAEAARFSPTTLGYRMLRAETAGVAALAILQSRLQEM